MFIIVLILFVIYLIYKFYDESYSFWAKQNVPVKKPSIPFGNFENFLFKKCNPGGVQFANLYNHFKSRGYKYGGIYVLHRPSFLPVDLDLIKDILSRDFAHFDHKKFFINEKDQPISANLFFIGGEKWKNIRVKMTPTFTSGKMKMMLPILLECCKPMQDHIESSWKNNVELDIKETGAKFTTDIIGSAAFGIECNSFKNPAAEFRKNGKRVFEEDYTRMVKAIFMINFQSIARKLHMVPFPKDAEEFFTNAIKDTIKYRKENNITKNDFMQMLMNLQDDNQITFEEVVAQAFVFFLAGFETSSTTMTFCLFELAQNQDIQDKLREEMRRVLAKYDGEITYEALGELTYTKQVIDETLRKYPPLPTIDRMCSKSYTIPEDNVTISEGTSIIISSLGIHRDPDNYPDPEKFDPDRFSAENIHNIKPYSYLPFGEGPRLCIGQRFGIMQTKIGLVTLLKDYKYTLNKKTSPNLELDFKFIMTPLGNILLDIEKIE